METVRVKSKKARLVPDLHEGLDDIDAPLQQEPGDTQPSQLAPPERSADAREDEHPVARVTSLSQRPRCFGFEIALLLVLPGERGDQPPGFSV